MPYRIIATVVFDSADGELPSPDAIATAINDALLARTQGGWSIVYAPARKWRVTFDVVNVRAEPTTQSAKVGEVYLGDTLTEISQRDGWLQIAAGWVSRELVTEIKSPP
jgi:hypothetical protein